MNDVDSADGHTNSRTKVNLDGNLGDDQTGSKKLLVNQPSDGDEFQRASQEDADKEANDEDGEDD